MIDITKLSSQDIGRGVVYEDLGVREDGIITDFNESFVFVRYKGDFTSKATSPDDLEWLSSQ